MRLKMILAAVWIAAVAWAEGATFNVGTYNIRQLNGGDDKAGNGWERREPVMAKLIRFHGFDIFGTQEGFKSQLEQLKADLPGYDYIGIGRDDGKEAGEHSAIFYRTDMFDLVKHGDFWLSEHPDRPGLGWDAVCVRICTWGRFRHKATGKEFLFFNLHMDHVGTKARTESAKLIKQKIDEFGPELPVFLTGDFNVDQRSESYATITEGGVLTDAFERAALVYAPNGTFNHYRTDGFTDQRIDHIFASPSVEVEKYGVLTDTYRTSLSGATEIDTSGNAPDEVGIVNAVPRTPSDHFPVLTTVTVN